jgi:hypothetical protein
VKNSFTVRNAQGLQLKLFTIGGRLVHSKLCTDPIEVIEISGLQAGLYILKIKGQVFKLVKQ